MDQFFELTDFSVHDLLVHIFKNQLFQDFQVSINYKKIPKLYENEEGVIDDFVAEPQYLIRYDLEILPEKDNKNISLHCSIYENNFFDIILIFSRYPIDIMLEVYQNRIATRGVVLNMQQLKDSMTLLAQLYLEFDFQKMSELFINVPFYLENFMSIKEITDQYRKKC